MLSFVYDMHMVKPKSAANETSVNAFLDSVEHETRREDARVVCALMEKITGEAPTMFGTSMIGFGSYHYKYASGREGDWFLTGLSPRKQNLVVYIMPGFLQYDDLMARLGKHKTGKSCLYLSHLADIDLGVLSDLIRLSVNRMREKYDT